MKKSLLLCFLCLLSLNSFAVVQFSEKDSDPSGVCQVSTRLGVNKEPLEDLQEVLDEVDSFTICTIWNNMREHNYEYVCTMYDSGNAAVYISSMIMQVTEGEWMSRTVVNPKTDNIAPGVYKIVITLDGDQYISKKLVVLESEKKEKKPASMLIGIGIDNIFHNEKVYFGGSYIYASAGYRVTDHLSAEVKYDFSVTPFFCKEQMITPSVTFYTGKIIKDTHCFFSFLYNNDLSGHDIGKIGGKLCFLDSAFDEDEFTISILPVGVIYDLETKGCNFMLEIMSLKMRL